MLVEGRITNGTISIKLSLFVVINHFISNKRCRLIQARAESMYMLHLRGCLPKILIPILDHITGFLETLHVSYTL